VPERSVSLRLPLPRTWFAISIGDRINFIDFDMHMQLFGIRYSRKPILPSLVGFSLACEAVGHTPGSFG